MVVGTTYEDFRTFNMASSGKKGKKTKGKTIALTDFLQDTPGPSPPIPLRKPINWADEVEEYDSYESRPKANIVLPTAPKAARGLDDYSDKIPQQPPYIAYLSNLPYDIDEEEIADFFRNLKIASMKIPKDVELPKIKGYGYVEFQDRDSLLGALAIPDCTLKNRRIRIEVATSSDTDKRRGGRTEMGRDRQDRPEVSTGDWRSGPRSDLPESDRDRRGGGSGFSRDRDSGFNRDRERDSGFTRDREGPSTERDRPGAWRDASDRPFKDMDRERGFSRDSDRGFGDRGRFSDRDGDRRGGFGDRDGDRRGFGPRRMDREDRNGGFTRSSEPPPEKSEPRTRPKLVLQPRTKPLEQPQPTTEQEPASPAPRPAPATAVPAASIFGNAKPVDTSARERQIEERLAKEHEKPQEVATRSESKWDDDRPSRRRFDRSPRRDSPGRRSSPPHRRSPIRNGSPGYSAERGGRRSPPYRRTESPVEKRERSVERRHRSPEGRRSPVDDRRPSQERPSRNSPPPRDVSPHSRKDATPEERRDSPPRRVKSLDKQRRRSPLADNRRKSPDSRRKSPDRKKSPAEGRRKSSVEERRRSSTEGRRKSPEGRRRSPAEGRKGSPDRKQLPPRKDDRKNQKSEKPKERAEKPRQREEKEMPKLKEPEPPNFASSNKFSYLDAEGDSD